MSATFKPLLLVLLLALLPSAMPTAESRTWRVGQGEVRVICPITVGGSFEAKTTSLTGSLAPAGSPSSYTSDVAVDLSTLDSGIDLRNEHLRNKYLEVGKGEGFQRAVLSDIHLGVDPETFEGRTNFSGTFHLHGVSKMIAGQVEIRRSAASVQVEASFPVTLADYGIAKPQYLGVGVKSQVQVKVVFVAWRP